MLEGALVLGVLGAVIGPHLLPLEKASGPTAAIIWFAALALRAVSAAGAAIFVLVYLPQTNFFQALASACWPLVSHHLGLSGDPLAHAAAVLPALTMTVSLLWLLFGLVRAGLSLRAYLRRRVLGSGPLNSVIISDRSILVATSGIGRARILVSEGALEAMDDRELEASFAHEQGHLRRWHRPVLLIASTLAALARLLPGTRRAQRELAFSLERDADEYAVRETRDPLALASAICKTATGVGLAATTSLSGSGPVIRRLGYLTGETPSQVAPVERAARSLASVLVVLTIVLWATVPSWAVAMTAGVAHGNRSVGLPGRGWVDISRLLAGRGERVGDGACRGRGDL